jgi:hypothetical protein
MNTQDNKPEDGPGPSDFSQSMPLHQRQVLGRQEHFLQAYTQLGKKSKAAEACNIPVATVDSWQLRDLHDFNKRIAEAHTRYVENLEQLMDERLQNPQGNRGSDVLLMFKLKAEAPQKYREEVKVVGIEASKQMMDKLRELAAKDRERAALEAPAVEGVYQEVTQAPTPPPVETQPMPPLPVAPPTNTPGPTAKSRLMERRLSKGKKPERFTRR